MSGLAGRPNPQWQGANDLRATLLAQPRLPLLPSLAVVVDAPSLKKLRAIWVVRGAHLIQVLESRIDGRATAHPPYPNPRIDRLAEQQRCDCRAAPKEVQQEGPPEGHDRSSLLGRHVAVGALPGPEARRIKSFVTPPGWRPRSC